MPDIGYINLVCFVMANPKVVPDICQLLKFGIKQINKFSLSIRHIINNLIKPFLRVLKYQGYKQFVLATRFYN